MNRRSESQFVARPRKNRKPPCSVCGSRRYRKNGLGFYFCEQGHQLENYVPEEADPLDMHFVRNRRLKQDTLLVNERRALKAMSTVLYGQEAKFHFYQCLQYIIKLQCNALINKFGLPAALETVVQELWVLYLSFCNVSLPADLAEYNTASSGRHDINDTENNNDEEIDKTDEWVDMQHHLNTMGFDNGSTEQDEDRSELIGSEVEEEEEEEGEKEQLQQRRKKAMTAGKSHAAMHIDSLTNPTMHHSIAICYLACIQLRCPVMLADLHRWIYDGQLPYLNAYSQLPDEYRLRINRQYRTKWQIIVNPSCSDFHRHIRVMAEMYYSQYSIQFPLPNKPLFIYRYLSELSLPIHLYPVAKYLLEVGQPTLEIQNSDASSQNTLWTSHVVQTYG
ncbi:hypothetical protein BDF19DRAFT_412997 [Syncephalis fuscata]|nr:hypothetical protein BDF19DRAFT_412997 [Syncephalis fuscata]